MRLGKKKAISLTGLAVLGGLIGLVASVEAVQFGFGQVNGLGLPYNQVSDPELLSLGDVLASIEKIAPDVADRIDVYQLDQLLDAISRKSGGGLQGGSNRPDLVALNRTSADPGWVVPGGGASGGDTPNRGSLNQNIITDLGKGSSGGGPISGPDDPLGGVGGSKHSMKGNLTRAGDSPDLGSIDATAPCLDKASMADGPVSGSDSPDLGSIGETTTGLGKAFMADGPVSGSDSPDVAGAARFGLSKHSMKGNLTRQSDTPDIASYGDFSNGISVDVIGGSGSRVSQVLAADMGDESYWFQYSSNGIQSRNVTFLAVPVFDGSPLHGIKQEYQPESNTNILSPFSIPFWAGNATSGAWVVIVTNDQGQSAMSYFEVIP